jgi:MFS family permease
MSEHPQQNLPPRHPKLSLFWAIWTANVLSTTGGFINDVGAAWLMTALSPSPLMVSLVQVVSNAPFFILALPGGALGDILDKRKLLLVTQIAMMILSAALGVLTVLGVITPRSLLWLLFGIEVFDALAGPAWQAVTPEIVDPKNLRGAITLNSVGINVARAVGPALGGALVAITRTSGPAFLVNAASFVGIIAVLWSWKRRIAKSALPAERLIGAMRIGYRFVRYAPAFRATLVRIAAYLLFASALLTLLPVIVRVQLHLGPSNYGVLLGFMGAGAVAAAPLLRYAQRVMKVDILLALATAMSAAVELAIAEIRVFPILCVVMVFAGVAWVTVMSTVNNAAQTVLPAWVRARAMSVYLMAFFGALTVGGLVWGIVATRYTPSLAMSVAACGMFATLVLIPFFRLMEQENLDLTPSLHWPAPVVVHAPEQEGGPVLITVEYRVDPQHTAPFVKAMHRLRLQRLRTGAFQWGLYNDIADPTRYVETFISESWAEHLRQHARGTVGDHESQDSLTKFLIGSEQPIIRHLIYAHDEPSKLPHAHHHWFNH